MTAKSLSLHECEDAIDAFLARYVGMVHRDDVGPLFGRLADLRRELRHYPHALAWANQAMRAALAPDAAARSERTVRWTHVIASSGGARRTTAAAGAPALHARIRAAMTGARHRTR